MYTHMSLANITDGWPNVGSMLQLLRLSKVTGHLIQQSCVSKSMSNLTLHAVGGGRALARYSSEGERISFVGFISSNRWNLLQLNQSEQVVCRRERARQANDH